MFTKTLVLAVLVGAAMSMSVNKFASWKLEHGKSYATPQEERLRFITFTGNSQRIDAHNERYAQGLETFAMALNHLADWTPAEYKARNTFRPKETTSGKAFVSRVKSGLPATVDWRPKGYVTPVKDQGQCGSCWSFSATGSLEGQHFAKTGKLVSLSEQNLVDCAHESYGCDGGWADAAFDYIETHGVDTEASYPYEARDDTCRYKASMVGATCKQYVDIKSKDEEALKEASATIGPISVAIDASHVSFQFYSHGIYSEPECSQNQLDHAVLVVGYGTDNGADYWLVKNSWNTNWGAAGYIKMQRNHRNACGISTQASYPEV